MKIKDTCSKCKKVQSPGNILRNGWCRDCTRKYQRERYANDPGSIDRARKRNLKSLYGMSLEEYDRMFKEQGGVCAICGQKETVKHKNGTVKSLAVDHSHATRAARGLLCQRCNQVVGRFVEHRELLRKAIAYLEKTD